MLQSPRSNAAASGNKHKCRTHKPGTSEDTATTSDPIYDLLFGSHDTLLVSSPDEQSVVVDFSIWEPIEFDEDYETPEESLDQEGPAELPASLRKFVLPLLELKLGSYNSGLVGSSGSSELPSPTSHSSWTENDEDCKDSYDIGRTLVVDTSALSSLNSVSRWPIAPPIDPSVFAPHLPIFTTEYRWLTRGRTTTPCASTALMAIVPSSLLSESSSFAASTRDDPANAWTRHHSQAASLMGAPVWVASAGPFTSVMYEAIPGLQCEKLGQDERRDSSATTNLQAMSSHPELVGKTAPQRRRKYKLRYSPFFYASQFVPVEEDDEDAEGNTLSDSDFDLSSTLGSYSRAELCGYLICPAFTCGRRNSLQPGAWQKPAKQAQSDRLTKLRRALSRTNSLCCDASRQLLSACTPVKHVTPVEGQIRIADNALLLHALRHAFKVLWGEKHLGSLPSSRSYIPLRPQDIPLQSFRAVGENNLRGYIQLINSSLQRRSREVEVPLGQAMDFVGGAAHCYTCRESYMLRYFEMFRTSHIKASTASKHLDLPSQLGFLGTEWSRFSENCVPESAGLPISLFGQKLGQLLNREEELPTVTENPLVQGGEQSAANILDLLIQSSPGSLGLGHLAGPPKYLEWAQMLKGIPLMRIELGAASDHQKAESKSGFFAMVSKFGRGIKHLVNAVFRGKPINAQLGVNRIKCELGHPHDKCNCKPVEFKELGLIESCAEALRKWTAKLPAAAAMEETNQEETRKALSATLSAQKDDPLTAGGTLALEPIVEMQRLMGPSWAALAHELRREGIEPNSIEELSIHLFEAARCMMLTDLQLLSLNEAALTSPPAESNEENKSSSQNARSSAPPPSQCPAIVEGVMKVQEDVLAAFPLGIGYGVTEDLANRLYSTRVCVHVPSQPGQGLSAKSSSFEENKGSESMSQLSAEFESGDKNHIKISSLSGSYNGPSKSQVRTRLRGSAEKPSTQAGIAQGLQKASSIARNHPIPTTYTRFIRSPEGLTQWHFIEVVRPAASNARTMEHIESKTQRPGEAQIQAQGSDLLSSYPSIPPVAEVLAGTAFSLMTQSLSGFSRSISPRWHRPCTHELMHFTPLSACPELVSLLAAEEARLVTEESLNAMADEEPDAYFRESRLQGAPASGGSMPLKVIQTLISAWASCILARSSEALKRDDPTVETKPIPRKFLSYIQHGMLNEVSRHLGLRPQVLAQVVAAQIAELHEFQRATGPGNTITNLAQFLAMTLLALGRHWKEQITRVTMCRHSLLSTAVSPRLVRLLSRLAIKPQAYSYARKTSDRGRPLPARLKDGSDYDRMSDTDDGRNSKHATSPTIEDSERRLNRLKLDDNDDDSEDRQSDASDMQPESIAGTSEVSTGVRSASKSDILDIPGLELVSPSTEECPIM